MNHSSALKPDVLVVGAGPVGLALASELCRHGVSCRIVDMNASPSIWSKAAVVHARTLEAFEAMGIAGEAVRAGRKVFAVNLYERERRVAHVAIDNLDSAYNYMLGLSQRETELLLERHLASQGVRVERRVELADFTQEGGRVTARLVHFDGEGEAARRDETIEVPWLAGCDGAHSTVRRILALPFEGSAYEESLIQADIRVDWPFPMPDDEAIFFLSPRGALGAIPLLAEGRYRLLALLEPGETIEPTLETFQMLLDQRGPAGARAHDPAWMVSFRFHHRMVPRYREGSVFLAGDAAHIHSPAGGQGMNLGILDAFNLAWKLALVIRGRGKPALLDAYDAERRPIAAATLRTTDAMTRVATRLLALRSPVTQELLTGLLGLVTRLPLFQERAAEALGGVGIDYRASPIVGQYQAPIWTAPLAPLTRTEAPGPIDWLSFDRGPGPGARVRDVELSVPFGDRTRLFELCRGTRHTLLLFDGSDPSPEGYANLDRVATRVTEQYGDVIQVYVVLPYGDVPEPLRWTGLIVLDEDGALHRAFGARSECLYLIRPDGHVGFRSQPADGGKLAQYLEAIFEERPAAG